MLAVLTLSISVGLYITVRTLAVVNLLSGAAKYVDIFGVMSF
jgi:hypothetical protein